MKTNLVSRKLSRHSHDASSRRTSPRQTTTAEPSTRLLDSGAQKRIPIHPPRTLSGLGRKMLRDAWSGNTATTRAVDKVLQSPSEPLPHDVRTSINHDSLAELDKVRIHTNSQAANSAARLGAAAYTAGHHIVFAPGQYAPTTSAGRHLLRHELAHVLQQSRASAELPPRRLTQDSTSEHFADAWARNSESSWIQPPPMAMPGAVMPSIAEKIIAWGAKRLEKQTAKLISKHIARHARQIAGRAIHSIFRNPREIRSLLKLTLKEAAEVAEKHAAAGTARMVEEGSIRLTRQATGSPGKFRLVIEKTFTREIGTAGQRVLRLVLDQTGCLVTAFPADRLLALGLGVAALDLLTERTAQAGEIVQNQADRQAQVAEREEEQSSSWWEWVPIIGDVWGGSLNVGEDEAIRQDQERQQIDKLIKETIDDLEKTEQVSFGAERRQEIEDLIRTAIAAPGLLEEAEEEGEGGQ